MEIPVYCNQRIIGKAMLQKQGMFYMLRCCCKKLPTRSCRLWLHVGNRKEDLGAFIEEGQEYTLVKRLAAKELDTQKVRFMVEQKTASEKQQLVTGGTVAHLDRLRLARLRFEGGKPVLWFDDQSNTKPTGQ